MHGDLIEEELQNILGSAAPPGIVITLRRHDEYEKLILSASGGSDSRGLSLS